MDIDPFNIYNRLALTDMIPVQRAGVDGWISGESFRSQTRPHLIIQTASFPVSVDDPSYKVDPRGQTVTATFPNPMTVPCREWQFGVIGERGTGGKLRLYFPAGGVASPFDDNVDLTEIILTRGQTIGIRSEVCLDNVDMAPQPMDDYGNQPSPLVNDPVTMPRRAIYLITRS